MRAATRVPGLAMLAAGLAAVLVCGGVLARAAQELTVQITSPLGRVGLSGPTRIVARIAAKADVPIGPVQFYVDGALVGEDRDGAPHAVEWVDDNPFVPREIVVQVADALGRVARDRVVLQPIELTDSANVASVVLEPSVVDADGRPVNGLTVDDFIVLENGVRQELDLAMPDVEPATYTLLVDSSQSMSRRIDFVRDAAGRLPSHLRQDDRVVIAPFTKALGAVTGPTGDKATIEDAIAAIRPGGGTAILNALVSAADRLRGVDSRHVLVLITDGYDEHSDVAFERALDAVRSTKATVYVIGVGGTAGISLKGEALLKRLAAETGGRAFFPAREFQLTDVHGLIAADVQQRYVLTYTPSNQDADGTWREIVVRTTTPEHVVRARSGYFAPAPPPIRPQIEIRIRDVNRQPVDISLEDLIVLEDGMEQQVEAFQEAVSRVSVVLAMDASGSMRRDAEAVVAAARQFVTALPPTDPLGVMLFADRPRLVDNLTTDRDGSLAAIGGYVAAGGTALYDAVAQSLERLRSVEGRRVVVVLTDGRDEDNPGTGPGSVRTLPQVLDLVREAEATVFTIGLGPNVDRATLEQLAKASGGGAYFPEDVTALESEYRRVLEELRRRWVLTYTSTNSTRDGSWRAVEVRSRREGVAITSQPGYRAPGK